MKNKGFTLIELLAVMVVLALIAIVVSGLVSNTVDKAKVTITKAQEESILNAAEKWSVDNSEVFDDIEGTKMQIGLDIVYIIDVSGSMRKTLVGARWNQKVGETRYYYTVEAINSSMAALQSPNNQVMITTFGNVRSTVLPLASYASSSGKFFYVVDNLNSYSTGSIYNSSAVKSTSDLKKVNVDAAGNITHSNVPTITLNFNTSHNYTQPALYYGVRQLISKRSKAEALKRIPVVIFITDGNVEAESNYMSQCSTCNSKDQSASGLSSYYYYALMAGYEARQELQNHYANSEVFFYTIGLGIDEELAARKILDPGSYDSLKKWNYVTKAFQQKGMTAADLDLAFSQITTEIIEATKVTQVCVTVKDLYENGYLSKKDIDMADGEAASTYVIMNYNEATKQYNFNLAKTPEQKKACEALLNK